MPVRKRFRIEEAIVGHMPEPDFVGGEIGPNHKEIMDELRAIRAQMANAIRSGGSNTANAAIEESAAREVAEARALLETYRAQIEQCEKLKVELDLIHDAINRTKGEIATLHAKSFNGEEMAKVNGELGAVVGGTAAVVGGTAKATGAVVGAGFDAVTTSDEETRLKREREQREYEREQRRCEQRQRQGKSS